MFSRLISITLSQQGRWYRVTAALLAGLFATCCGFAQGTSPTTSPASSIGVNVNEVSLDLLVHDNKGRPVLNLTAPEIRVTDDGSVVQLTNLRYVSNDQPSWHKVALVFGKLDAAGDTNARKYAAKILDALPKGFSFAVMNVGSRLRLLQTFTIDRAKVDKAVELATVQERRDDVQGDSAEPEKNAGPEKNLIAVAQTGADASGNSVTASDRAVAKVLLASLEDSQRIVQDQNIPATLSSLLALARNERNLSGRRAIIYFTEGMHMDANSADAVRSVVGAANQSGVTIYVVDLSALDEQSSNEMAVSMAMGSQAPGAHAAAVAPATPGAIKPPPGELREVADLTVRLEMGNMEGTGTPLAQLATSTGGAYLIGGDSAKKPLKRMVEDMTTYYEASFIPSIKDYDGSFRPVQVTSMRKDLVLKYRAGYFALAPDAASRVRPFEGPLLKMLGSSSLPGDLTFHAGVLRMGALQDGDANTLTIEAPLDELDVRKDPNTKLYSLHLTMVAQIKNKEGVVIDHFSEDLPQHGAIESLERGNSQVITLQRHFIAPPGDYVVEAAILDQNSDKAGAQRINFEVPKDTHGLGLSDMVLVRRTEMIRADADPLEPLRYGSAKVIANVSGEVDRDAKNVSVFFIIHPGAGKAPVKLEMEVAKEGRPIGKIPLPVRSDAKEGTAVPYFATLQTHSLSPGRYEVAALLTQGDQSMRQTIEFTITGLKTAGMETHAIADSGEGGGEDAEPVSDSSLPDIGEAAASKLMITSPANPISAPTAQEREAILAQARGWVLHYSESLPNFLCVETTTRSVDVRGNGDWKQKDEIAQMLKYRDGNESRIMLEVNGKRSKEVPDIFKQMSTRGQFGGVLNAVFEASAKAEFQWKETDMLGTGKAQVFSYQVKAENSSYNLTGNDAMQLNVAFHGLVYIDAATMGVRRITLQADGLPRKFSIHASAMAVDYDYVVINRHDYLVPIHAAITLRQRKHEDVLDEIEFRDYKRFGSRVRILAAAQIPGQ